MTHDAYWHLLGESGGRLLVLQLQLTVPQHATTHAASCDTGLDEHVAAADSWHSSSCRMSAEMVRNFIVLLMFLFVLPDNEMISLLLLWLSFLPIPKIFSSSSK